MKGKKIYRLVLENESSIERVASWRLSPLLCVLVGIAAFSIFLFFAGILIWITPLHNLLPGYMQDKERSFTEESLLRIDSLSQAMRYNEQFLANLHNVLDIDRTPADSANATRKANHMTSDSLMPTSKEEERFIAVMQERERYNLSVIAPLASEGMIFYPVSTESIITEETKTSTSARIILAEGAPVESIADGMVVAVYTSERDGGGHTVLIQHKKGFLSAYSRLSMPMVGKGDRVSGGQTIAVQQSGLGMRQQEIILRLWHNSTQLVPYEYISTSQKPERDGSQYEAPRGRL